MIKVESKIADYAINVPTKREEITPEALGALLKDVKVAKYYCVVAMIYKDTLFGVMNRTNEVVTVIPVLAKISDEDSSSTGGRICDQLIIDRTSLERGNHLHIKNNIISPSHISEYIRNDKGLSQSIGNGTFGQNKGHKMNTPVYMLEFKIIPVNDIKAMIDNNVIADNNPFKADKEIV